MEEGETTQGSVAENGYDASGLPSFNVTVPEAVKRGENVFFTIQTTVLNADKGYMVLRQHEDLEWLHHMLVSGNDTNGVIIPPLPLKPQSDPKSAEQLSRRHLGDNTKVLRGDQFEVDCKSVQKYLELMLVHPLFGRDTTLSKFLTEEEAPIRAKLNKGIMSMLSSAIEVARKSNHKDLDEYFTQQRHNTAEFSKTVKDASLNYNKLLVSQWRLSSSYRQLATELTSCTAERDEELIKLNRVLKLLSDGCEDEAGSLELKSSQGELTLGLYLDLFARYSESLKEMHLRRTCALIDFQTSEKVLEKAKPIKRSAAEDAFETAKKTFEKCSELARKEIKAFTQFRILYSADILTSYAELQVKIAQDFYSQLFHTRKLLLEQQLGRDG